MVTFMEDSSCKQHDHDHEHDDDDDAANDIAETLYFIRKEKSADDGGHSPCLERHSSFSSESVHIKVGSFYEIDHSKLSHKSPHQLSIRVVMVNEKTNLKVSLRFPSLYSLRSHFNDGSNRNPEGKKIPALDEKYLMDSNEAGDVLFRRIPSEELAEQRNTWDFWVGASTGDKRISSIPSCGMVAKKGGCWSEVKFSGMVQWGKRRQVHFFGQRKEKKLEPLSRDVECSKEDKMKDEYDVAKEEEETMECEVVPLKSDSPSESKKNHKRKRSSSRSNIAKRVKRERQTQVTVYGKSERKVIKNSIDRWSAERYKLAEKNMLKIMKAKGAVFGKPILRPELRSEARKLIGDTGLLDHLLKHMAGQVAPGGADRFRRRHNADGAMEYWLENADLVNIRKEAGVQDPYWNPPPGWKLGDNPTQDPICARELKELKEEMAKMKSDMLDLVLSKKEDNLAIVTLPPSPIVSQHLQKDGSLPPLKEMYTELVKKKAKIEEQLKEISQSLSGMEAQITKLDLKSMEEPKEPEVAETPPALLVGPDTPSGTVNETKQAEQKNKAILKSGEQEDEYLKEGDKTSKTQTTTAAAEDKAALIQRLRSGFRLCKPQGSFLWPNMVKSPQVVVQLEDLLVVPTPPSVTSSSATPPPHHHLLPQPPQYPAKPLSPVKPFATKTTLMDLNLNEIPINNNIDGVFCGNTQTHSSSSSLAHHYQRRHQTITTITSPPNIETKGSSSSSLSLSWLGITTLNPSMDVSKRG